MKKKREPRSPLCIEPFYRNNKKQLSQGSFLIGYSGGLDSHVLLHFFAQLQKQHPCIKLRSIYVDHGLQKQSPQWAKHCKKICQALKIPHQTLTLSIDTTTGESIEALARTARYQIIKQHLLTTETLITAHHQDDQAETLLLQLFRGAGPDGLAAMPNIGNTMGFQHWRPFLNILQKELTGYADQYQLNSIEDPTNQDLRFDRNYIRHQLIPTLQSRWPQITKTLTRSAAIQAESSTLISRYTSQSINRIAGSKKNTLSSTSLKSLPAVEQRALLRFWIKQAGHSAPSAKKLKHIIHDGIYSHPERSPSIEWADTSIRRYRDDLYIIPKLPIIPPSYTAHWNLLTTLDLGYGLPKLKPESLKGLERILLDREITVTVKLRQGGEHIRLHKNQQKSLKKLLQEHAIPPWQRDRLPLVYINQTLIYIYNIAVSDSAFLMDYLNENYHKNL